MNTFTSTKKREVFCQDEFDRSHVGTSICFSMRNFPALFPGSTDGEAAHGDIWRTLLSPCETANVQPI